MEIALIRNSLLAVVVIVNPLGKIPIWIEASEGCDGPVRTRLAMLVTGTATALLLAFLFFGQSILDFLGLGESFPNWISAASPLVDDVQGKAGSK